jgi:hypothetical protein
MIISCTMIIFHEGREVNHVFMLVSSTRRSETLVVREGVLGLLVVTANYTYAWTYTTPYCMQSLYS